MFHIKNILSRMMSSSLVAGTGFAALLCGASPAAAATSPALGAASSYAILAGSAVTNTGATTIAGDVGIYPGIGPVPHYTGFGTVVFVGSYAVHDADVAAQNAQAASGTAYGALDQSCDFDYTGTGVKELAGLFLVPGVYCADSFHLTSGTLTLTGLASDVWIFKSASDLIITGGAAAKVVSPSCDVWWRVVSTASFDAGSSLIGNILADTSITLAAGASLSGKAFARTAEVTLIGNAISVCNILAPTPTPIPPTPTPIPPTPTPIPPTPTPTPTLTLSTVASPGVALGAAIFDTATLSGGNAPTGTITFNVYGPNDSTCGTTSKSTSTAVVPSGTYTSASFTPSATGTYRWIARYSGDANNAAVLTACADVSESVIVSAAVPAAGIPTLSGWGLMTLMVLVVIASIYRLRRL
jgi:hypothetical protein